MYPRDQSDAPSQAVSAAIEIAREHSPFLRGLLLQHPDIPETLAGLPLEQALQRADPGPNVEPARRLRIARARTMLAIALADLSGMASLEVATLALSTFADWALDQAIEAVLGSCDGFSVIALGKHGSRELNYSSDIDPILLFDPDILPRRKHEEPIEAALRAGQRIVALLQARDGDGFVFRVDLRLRPASEVTPIVMPVNAAIQHYESMALPWERAAYIRARAAAGDKRLGQSFLDAVRPFVWRRNLDFGAIGDLRALTQSIRATHGSVPFGPGYDVKRGRGGIREVEFYAQVHQLIHGGRDATLRQGATLDALAALKDAGWIEAEVATRLANAYPALRTVEHRLQLIDDRQTHSLPGGEALDGVARLCGLPDAAALLAMLAPHVGFVERTYDALDDSAPSTDRTFLSAARQRFDDPSAIDAQIARWRSGSVRTLRSPAAMEAFDAAWPELIEALSRAPDPDAAMARLDLLLDRMSSGVNLFRLLDARPALIELLVGILSHAPVLGEALARHPEWFDRLLDRSAFEPLEPLDALVGQMRPHDGDATEIVLDRIRRAVGEHRLALGVQLVEGRRDPLAIACDYARLAEAAVQATSAQVVADFEVAHGVVEESEFVILALGRLGGGALTHASDLDLIYLHTGAQSDESDGSRPLSATLYYHRIAARVTGGLSVPTAVGPLYEIDTRLRPSGAQGPLVVSLNAFERYQREAAWTWEHMALLRARPIFGSTAARARLIGIIAEALSPLRESRQLARDVSTMRREIAQHKQASGPFDVKLFDGGLVDLEFAVHFEQLRSRTGIVPNLRSAIAALADADLVQPTLLDAHDLLTRLLVVLRLVAPDLSEPRDASRPVVAHACGCDNWKTLLARLADARQCVRDHWQRVEEAA